MELRQSVFIATSLDGFIARKDGDIDWLLAFGDDVGPYGYEEFISSIDALVMGRNSFEKVIGFNQWPYERPVVVLTHRPLDVPEHLSDQVHTTSGLPEEIISELAQKEFYHLYIDGGKTIQQFLNAGFIQEITITTVPVLIGEGISLFGPTVRDITLEHITTKSFKNGFVQTKYKVNQEG